MAHRKPTGFETIAGYQILQDLSPLLQPAALAVERPLEVRIRGETRYVLLRTPGHDEELALGFLWTEGVLCRLEDLWHLSRPNDVEPRTREDVLEIELDPARSRLPESALRQTLSACGTCGPGSLAALSSQVRVLPPGPEVSRKLLFELPARMTALQSGYRETGGLHAAALFESSGQLLVLREDVGRHNAVDKVLGWAIQRSMLPLGRHLLLVSGRLGSEIVLKALTAGIPLILGLGAATSLACALAHDANATLVGFLRSEQLLVYCAPERIR